MEKISKIVAEFERELDFVEADIDDVLIRAEQGIELSKNTLDKLRELILKDGFSSAEDEINFFKHIKPQVYSKLIFYVKLFHFEDKRPKCSIQAYKDYLDAELNRIETFYNDNLEFHRYYRRGSTILDDRYFIRGNTDIRLYPDSFHFIIDDQFSTSHDHTVAAIMANDLMSVYIKQELTHLENQNNQQGMNTEVSCPSLKWTGKKIALIELVYALSTSGVLNHGQADLSQITELFQKMFGVELGDYYRKFLEIRMRKTGRTKFLDQLRENLIRRMDEADSK